jgi:hypothetical protein
LLDEQGLNVVIVDTCDEVGDPFVSGGSFSCSELSNIVLVVLNHVGKVGFKRSREVTGVPSHAVEDDVEHFVGIGVCTVVVCVYVDVCRTNDTGRMECVYCEEVCNRVRVRAGYGDGVGVNVVVYVVSVVFLSGAVKRVRKKTDFSIVILEVTERGTEDFGSEECVTTCEGRRNGGVTNGLTFRHSPEFSGLVDNVGPRFSVLVYVECEYAVSGGHDGETGSGVQTVRSVDGSDPTSDIAYACGGVDGRVTVCVVGSFFDHERELVHGPFFVSNELVNIDVCDRSGVSVNSLVVNESVSTVESGKCEVTNDAVEGFLTGGVLDGVGVYVLLVPPIVREVDGTGTDGHEVVSVTTGSNAGNCVVVSVEVCTGSNVTGNFGANVSTGSGTGFTLDNTVIEGFDQSVSFTNSNADCVCFVGVDFLCAVKAVGFTVTTVDDEGFAAEGNVFVTGHFVVEVEFTISALSGGFGGAARCAGCTSGLLGGCSGVFAGVIVATCHEKNAEDHEHGKSQSQKSFHEKISFLKIFFDVMKITSQLV